MAEIHKVAVRKKAEQLDRLIQDTYITMLENEHIPAIKEIIMDSYDVELTGRVTTRKSKTNPVYYRDEFEAALDEFIWIEPMKGQTLFTTPETDNFNWNQGRLRIVQNIVEGTIGRFIEASEEQYIAMYEKRPIIQPFDRAVPIRERIYLLKFSGDVRRRWRETFPGDNPVEFPFSNTPPINIFDASNRYVEDNMRSWIDMAIKTAEKEIK